MRYKVTLWGMLHFYFQEKADALEFMELAVMSFIPMDHVQRLDARLEMVFKEGENGNERSI